jgi:hypothetical protein
MQAMQAPTCEMHILYYVYVCTTYVEAISRSITILWM